MLWRWALVQLQELGRLLVKTSFAGQSSVTWVSRQLRGSEFFKMPIRSRSPDFPKTQVHAMPHKSHLRFYCIASSASRRRISKAALS